MMTRKNYQAIANCISRNTPQEPEGEYDEGRVSAASSIAFEIAAVMAADNPRFDRTRFMKACGYSQ